MVLYIDHTKYLLSCAYNTNGERSFHVFAWMFMKAI